MKWILIITLSNAGTIYGGKSIHSIDFESQVVCQSAGEQWKSNLHKDDQKLATFVCVKNK